MGGGVTTLASGTLLDYSRGAIGPNTLKLCITPEFFQSSANMFYTSLLYKPRHNNLSDILGQSIIKYTYFILWLILNGEKSFCLYSDMCFSLLYP